MFPAIFHKERSVLPGFGLALASTLLYLSVLVLIPLGILFWRASGEGWTYFWQTATDARALASYRVTFGCALAAALINAPFGFLVAWVLVRYSFPGKNIVDALVDLPFALPTAVGGLALTAAYAPSGMIGQFLTKIGIKAVYTPLGIILALVFISLPFVVRTVQPVLQELDAQLEEAASSLGAGRWETFRRILFPAIFPAVITGFALAFARSIGEYGSVIFIAGNLPFKTEIAPLLIAAKLDQFDYAGATALAVVLLTISFALLLSINGLQWWSRRHNGS